MTSGDLGEATILASTSDLDIFDQELEGLPPFVLDERAWSELLPPEQEVKSAQVVSIASTENRFMLSTNDPRSRRALETEFRTTATASRRALGQLGLHREFGSVLGSMLKETRIVVIAPLSKEATKRESEFYIVKDKESDKIERLLLLHPDEVSRDAARLRDTYRTLRFTEAPSRALSIVSMEWIIGRKIMDLACTACYVRQEYGEFKQGFGGYTPPYMSRRTIALNYLATNNLSPEAFNDPDVETARIINGFGLQWLENILIRRKLVGNDREAQVIMRAVLKQDRKRLGNSEIVTDQQIGAAAALSKEELMERFAAIFPNPQPAFTSEAMNDLADSIGIPE